MKIWLKKLGSLNPAVKGLLIFVFGALILAFAFAPTPKPIDLHAVDFNTTSDSRLYFHNVRSFYYHIDASSKKPMRIYSLRRRQPKDDSLSLQFNIVQNPSSDQSFILAQAGKGFKQYDSLSVGFSNNDSTELLFNATTENHYRIAAKVLQALNKSEAVFLIHKNDTLKRLYQEDQSRINAEITLEDYFKLINKR